jgi:hypothetical protein
LGEKENIMTGKMIRPPNCGKCEWHKFLSEIDGLEHIKCERPETPPGYVEVQEIPFNLGVLDNFPDQFCWGFIEGCDGYQPQIMDAVGVVKE